MESSEPTTAAPPPSEETSTLTPEEKELKRAAHYLLEGKRNFLVRDYTSAMTALGEACSLLTELHGDNAHQQKDYAEAHFYYGKSLLEQARLDLSIIETPKGAGEAQDGDSESEEEDDDEVEDENPLPESTEGAEGVKDIEESPSDENEAEKKEEEDLAVPSPTPAPAEPTPGSSTALGNDNEQPSTSGGPPKAPEDGEDIDEPSNLELAWEVFEIAKIAYEKQLEVARMEITWGDEDKEKVKNASIDALLCKLSDIYSLLGEVATESENYQSAFEDYTTALRIMNERSGGAPLREIAQIHFLLGVTLAHGKDFKGSVENFEMAAAKITERIGVLEAGEVTEGSKLELAELKDILPEIQEKIKDTQASEIAILTAEEEERKDREMIIAKSPLKNPNLPAPTDISHLVRKKRKEEPSEGAPVDNGGEPATKKLCLNEENGHGTNGNGQALP